MTGTMAQRSFAEIRVGIRGSGNSEDHYYEEYTLQELQDGVKVIQWLAAQSWWYGLQLTAMAPPDLHGVVSLYSIDNHSRTMSTRWGGKCCIRSLKIIKFRLNGHLK
ncbi:hypothetical protein PF007_g24012 [Phytophthora fragariae]|uniref:Xaa-Pro dipeptidyl-peptidase-like domain-containing protein n=3 Tax=Phytophthora TaxID=4783 RepID=A0A6A3QKK7_9STRA|nr:hypothetical protein PF007_g24012 [Phytophthora fragariae]